MILAILLWFSSAAHAQSPAPYFDGYYQADVRTEIFQSKTVKYNKSLLHLFVRSNSEIWSDFYFELPQKTLLLRHYMKKLPSGKWEATYNDLLGKIFSIPAEVTFSDGKLKRVVIKHAPENNVGFADRDLKVSDNIVYKGSFRDAQGKLLVTTDMTFTPVSKATFEQMRAGMMSKNKR